MRKFLLSVSLPALLIASATASASSPDVSVGGFARFQFGFFDDAHKSSSNRDAQMESEIYVKAKAQTESGLEYGAKVELKTSTSDTTMADEVTIWMESRFGRLEVGDQDGAADVMAYYAPKVGFGGAVDGDFTDWTHGASKPQIGSKVIDSKDSTKITYYTPRFYGFQIGVSYAPELDHGENIIRTSEESLSSDAANGNSPFPFGTIASNSDLIDHVQPAAFNAPAASGGDNVVAGNANKFFQKSYKDFIELGVNYVQKFNDFDVNLAFGYSHADQKSVFADLTAFGDPSLVPSAMRRHIIEGWHAGGQFGWRQFRIGGSYVDNLKSGQLKRYQSQDRKAWNIGISYGITDMWDIGANYIQENLGGHSGNGDYRAFGLSTAYLVAPGLSIAADYVDYRRDFGRNNGNNLAAGETLSKPTTLKDNKTKDDGHVVILGTRLDF